MLLLLDVDTAKEKGARLQRWVGEWVVVVVVAVAMVIV